MLSAGALAFFPSLLVLVTTRIAGLASAGFIAFAVAVVELPRLMINFGVRAYQSTDIKEEYRFGIYFGLRNITASVFTIIAFIVFFLAGNFEPYQLTILLLIYFIYLTDSYADVFMGDMQQKGKMRISGKMRTTAFLGAFVIFTGVLLFSQSVHISLVAAGLAVLCCYIVWIWHYRFHFGAIRVKLDITAIKKLSLGVLPLLVAGVLSVFLLNAQKYYLEALFSSEVVGLYAILLLPVSLLTLVCASFFQGAAMTKTAKILADGNEMQFRKRVNRQLFLSLGIFLPFIVFVYFFGIQILSWLYAVDLHPYRMEFLILSFGGIARVTLSVLGPVLVILRKQRVSLYCMIAVALTAGPLMWWLVSQYGLFGAAFSNFVIFLPQAVVLYAVYRIAN